MASIMKRPGTLTFVAVVLFGFAAVFGLNALSTGFYAINVAMDPKAPNANAKIEIGDTAALVRFIADEIPNYVAISLGFATIDILFSIAQFICGLNILRLRPWARKATILLILVRLLYIFGYDGFEGIVIVPITMRALDQGVRAQLPGPGAPAGQLELMFQILSIAIYGMIAVKIFVEIVAAFLIIILLSTTKAKNAFAGVEIAPETTLTEDRERSQYAGYEDETGAT